MDTSIRLLAAAIVLGGACPAGAQTRPVDLGVATLEDLMNIEITSASRKEQRAEEVPAAVYVITHDDIRRSGMMSVPDLLRLVPGVQVAQINSNKWAVSVRGFNSLYSNKLLVLVDGRSLYNPLFATVLWDTEDLMLEDIDRIEVVRGPGAAVWGANAVNGVINIVTRAAADTSGLLVRAGAGTFDRGSVAVRYGGTAGSGAYRTFAQFTTHDNSELAGGAEANDRWRSVTSGFRGDWSSGPDAFMLQGGLTAGEQRPLWVNLHPAAIGQPDAGGVSGTQGGHALGRWTHARRNGASLQLQSFVDIEHRRESIFDYGRQTLDLDASYHSAVGRQHDLVVGGGFRFIRESTDGGVGYAFNPSRARETLVNAFAQDEIALARLVHLTLGAKVEHDNFTGFGLQPTARLMWQPRPKQHLWAAVSHALRTPSLLDRGVRIDFPPLVPDALAGAPEPAFPIAVVSTVIGNPAVANERLISTEAGYRLDIASRATIDVTGFFGRYQNLQTHESSAPAFAVVGGRPLIFVSTTFENLLDADTRGVELTGRMSLSSAWQVDASMSTFHLTPHADPSSNDIVAPIYDGDAPALQWRVHSALSLGPRTQADVLLFHAGRLRGLGVAAYTRADLRLEWKATPRLSASVQGQNLLSPSHREFIGSRPNIITTEIPRNVGVRLTWQFQR